MTFPLNTKTCFYGLMPFLFFEACNIHVTASGVFLHRENYLMDAGTSGEPRGSQNIVYTYIMYCIYYLRVVLGGEVKTTWVQTIPCHGESTTNQSHKHKEPKFKLLLAPIERIVANPPKRNDSTMSRRVLEAMGGGRF